MSMPTYVGRSASVANSGNAITPALPGSLLVNDILVLLLETANQAIAIPTPNGGTWAEAPSSPQGLGTGGAADAVSLTIFWSRYNGTQGNPTTSDSGNHQTGCIFAIRGCVPTGDPINISSGGTQAATTSLSVTGATTTRPNCFVMVGVATDKDAADTDVFASEANADLANLTERVDQTFSGAQGGGLYCLTGEKAVAGAYGATTATQDDSEELAWITLAFEGASSLTFPRKDRLVVPQFVPEVGW